MHDVRIQPEVIMQHFESFKTNSVYGLLVCNSYVNNIKTVIEFITLSIDMSFDQSKPQVHCI